MNVILICLDTYRADCVAATGRNDFIKTPNLDRLVREGVLFDNAFGEGQPTIQFRRALATGMRAFPYTGTYDTVGSWPACPGWHKIPPEQPTLAEVLLEGGFRTGLSADTYHMFKPTMNFTRGMASWDFIRGQESDPWRCGPMSAIDPSKWIAPGIDEGVPVLVQYLLNVAGRQGEMDWLPAQVFSSAIRFVEDNAEHQPFFLWVDSFDPHEPFDPPREYADLYDPDWDEEWEPIIGFGAIKDEKTRRRVKALYYGECSFVDKQVGRLLDTLEDKGLLDETLIWVCSDHGTELWQHGKAAKGYNKCRHRCNNEILSIMRFPEKQYAGTRVKGFVQNQDIFPTVCSLLGVEHGPVDGLDVMPLVRGEVEALRDHVVTGWSGGRSGVMVNARDHEFSYATIPYAADAEEVVFDLVADPGETRDVAAERPEVCATGRARIEALLGESIPATDRSKTFPYTLPATIWLKNDKRTDN